MFNTSTVSGALWISLSLEIFWTDGALMLSRRCLIPDLEKAWSTNDGMDLVALNLRTTLLNRRWKVGMRKVPTMVASVAEINNQRNSDSTFAGDPARIFCSMFFASTGA